MAELCVGRGPNAAAEFKRGGFLECAKQATPLPIWLDWRPRERWPTRLSLIIADGC